VISPLEALHPAARVERLLMLGERCPPALAPPDATASTTDVDLALIAPSAGELARAGWLARAASAASAALRPDGLAYVLLPRWARVLAGAQLERAGLVVDSRLVHLPATGLPRYLIPLERDPWRHALTRQVAAHPRVRRALIALREPPLGASLLQAALPTVGVVARRPGAEPLAAWTGRLEGETRRTGRTIVATSWRGASGPILLLCFADGEREPWGIAKLAPAAEREARSLDRLGGAARGAGALVPRLLASGRAGGGPVLVESLVDGRSAAELLTRRPERFLAIATGISEWQERWNRATRGTAAGAADQVGRDVLLAADELGDSLPHGAAYRSWIAARCDALGRDEVPLVARHNDLTMWNVTVDGDGGLGVLDWAEADDAGLPLTDFFYAVADAAAAADRYRSRLHAVRSCFTRGGRRAQGVAPLKRRLEASLGLGPEAVELCFHACWLRHALNERRAGGSADRPFLEIVRWLARRVVENGE